MGASTRDIFGRADSAEPAVPGSYGAGAWRVSAL